MGTLEIDCVDDRVLGMADATTQFVQSRVEYDVSGTALEVRSPSVATPITGARAPASGSTLCKVAAPPALLDALITLRGGTLSPAAGPARILHAILAVGDSLAHTAVHLNQLGLRSATYTGAGLWAPKELVAETDDAFPNGVPWSVVACRPQIAEHLLGAPLGRGPCRLASF